MRAFSKIREMVRGRTEERKSTNSILDFFKNRRERASVESKRNGETGVYTVVNEDFEYCIDSNHACAVGFERSLLSITGLRSSHFVDLGRCS